MENLNTNEDIKRIRENSDFNRKNTETKGVLSLLMLPVWIWIIFQALKGLI